MPITLESGWKQAKEPESCAAFMAASRDPASGFSRLGRFGGADGYSPIEVHGLRSLSCVGGQLFFIAPTEGVFSCHLNTQDRKQLLAPQRGHPLRRLWVSPDAKSAMVLRVDSVLDGSNSLLKLDLLTGRVETLKKFGRGPEFLEVAWLQNCYFASNHGSDSTKRIERTDLKTGETQLVHESAFLQGIAISEDGSLAHWHLLDFGPINLLKDGAGARLTEFGWFASFSKNGDMAFLMGDHTLWVRTREGRFLRIASTWSPRDPAQTDFPTWCHCGMHVAAMLGGEYVGEWLARDLVIADLTRKEVTIFNQAVIDPAAHREGGVWLDP